MLSRARTQWCFALLGAACLAVTGCSRRFLSTFLDLPAREEAAPPRAPQAPGPAAEIAAPAVPEQDTPAFEATLDPDSALAFLPRDHAGNVDWMAALRNGVIRPRPALPGRPAPPEPSGSQFAFDFFLPGPDSTFDAYFPHSAHTEWLACQQCHPRIFPYRGARITMADILQGRYCGECHGKVAFPVATGCERCHPRLAMPPGRATPVIVGDAVLRRVTLTNDSTAGPNPAVASTADIRADDLPPARMPHWVHRSRFRCKACHMDVFVPRSGANAITMADISAGRACGQCHDGQAAFRAGFGACHRCHRST